MSTSTIQVRSVLARLTIATGIAALLLAFWAGPSSAQAATPAVPGTESGGTPVETGFRPSYRDQLGLAVPAGTAAADSSADTSASVMPFQPYTDWTWPTEGHTSTSETLTVNAADPGSHFYWAYDFAIGGGGVGYTGLQTGAYPSNNKIALFAIWGADQAQGNECGPFDGEGVGWTCRIDPFAWTAGHPYALRVAVDGTSSTGTWYKATIRDTTTGALSTIGRIHHPTRVATITGRGSWTEWFGNPSSTCEALKRSVVTWARPTAQDGRVQTTSHHNHTEPKDGSVQCSDSASLDTEGDNVTQRVGPK